MGTKTKLTLACTFVAMVATAATAFGQTGSGSGDGSGGSEARRARRAADRREQGDRCGAFRPRTARRMVHSETKFKASEGFGVRTVDQGEITAIDDSAKKITIKRLDGETVSAIATKDTGVCKDGKVSSFDALEKGDVVRLISIRSAAFTGLRKIRAMTPGSAEQRRPSGRGAAASRDVLEDPVELPA
jgi:hypothetical protein